MVDYSFFALLFLIANTLAPDATHEVAWVNERHPEQTITWTHAEDGWRMQVNGRDLGVLRRDGDVVVHDTGQGTPARVPVSRLARVARGSRRVRLLGQFAPTVLEVDRSGPRLRLVDPGRALLRTPLRLTGR